MATTENPTKSPSAVLSKLTATRGVRLPDALLERLRETPLVRPEDPDGRFADPDFRALFRKHPAARAFAKQTEGTSISVNPFAPPAAMLLYAGAELVFDWITTLGGLTVVGNEVTAGPGSAPAVRSLEGILPTVVVDWLLLQRPEYAVWWCATLLAEIQFHAATLAAGEFPTPHSLGSEVALVLMCAEGTAYINTIYDCGGSVADAFEELGGDTDYWWKLQYLVDLLLGDDLAAVVFDEDEAERVMGSVYLHPANWFTPFDADLNPWPSVESPNASSAVFGSKVG